MLFVTIVEKKLKNFVKIKLFSFFLQHVTISIRIWNFTVLLHFVCCFLVCL